MDNLAVIVLTLNEEKNLPACLESLSGLGARLFVADSGSTDGTVAIAERYGADVTTHPFENYGAQRNWAQDHLPWRAQWVLHLDADERLTPELRENIVRAMRDDRSEIDGFLVARRTEFLGRWIKHGGHYPVYHLRLFRRDRGHCEGRRYDQHFIVGGRVEKLPGDLIDTITADVETWVKRHAHWAKLEAEEILHPSSSEQVAVRWSGTPIERRRWLRNRIYNSLPLFVRPVLYFLYRYFLRAGFLDGTEGLLFHFIQGGWFRFMIDAHIYELKKRT